jgi:hypothetical protein
LGAPWISFVSDARIGNRPAAIDRDCVAIRMIAAPLFGTSRTIATAESWLSVCRNAVLSNRIAPM